MCCFHFIRLKHQWKLLLEISCAGHKALVGHMKQLHRYSCDALKQNCKCHKFTFNRGMLAKTGALWVKVFTLQLHSYFDMKSTSSASFFVSDGQHNSALTDGRDWWNKATVFLTLILLKRKSETFLDVFTQVLENFSFAKIRFAAEWQVTVTF